MADLLWRRHRAYRTTFATPPGQQVLRDLIRRNYVLATSMTAGEPQVTAFNEGRRAAVLDILAALRLSADDLRRLSQERASGGDTPEDWEAGVV